MDILWFKNLANLAKTGNFTHAAELNNISQSAFSRRIKALEEWVGAPLVDRSNYPIKLTDHGRQMLEAGEQALARIEAERIQIQETLSQPDKYVVTFAAQHSISWRFYPAWLQAFEEAFGPIISRLRADDLPNCLSDLKRGEVDFAISYVSDHAGETGTEFDSITIGKDRLVPVAKASANGDPLFHIDNASTVQIPYLRFGQSAPIGRHVDPVLEAQNLNKRLTTVYENSMAGALRIRARDGLGMAWLPQSLVQPDIEAGLLTLAGADKWAINVEIHLHRLKRNDHLLTRKIWTFLVLREGVPLV